MKVSRCILVFSLILRVKTQNLDNLIGPFRIAKIAAFNMLKDSVETEDNLRMLKLKRKMQPILNPLNSFPCNLNNTRSKTVPLSVHELRPGDIDVIAGIGDSLTAGVGLTATHPLQVAFENRGMGPTAGGAGVWREIFTVPNMLKVFNPNLVGYATGPSLTLHKESQFNLGETGTLSEDTPYMSRLLIKRMINHPKVDIKNHWKMISYMVGPNNFCTEICFHDNMTEILENHKKDVYKVLRSLKKNLPRTIVNIIPAPNVKLLTEITDKTIVCEMEHLMECPCLFGLRSIRRREYFELMKNWQKAEIEIATDDEFDTNDFTVVAQPFTVNFFIPKNSENKIDLSYLSEDCFHMSQKGNARIALSLWNNIWEPVGKKRTGPVEFNSKIGCPSEASPFIFTRRNS